jgi:DNA invertase Pin-like site-specific DNA recombinase
MYEWMSDNKKGLMIVRRSSKGQEDNFSADVQEKGIHEYCSQNGIEVVKIVNIIESAKDSSARKKYHAAVDWALQNKVRHILYYMTDREVRNFTDLESMEKLILKDLIVVHYVRDRRQLHRGSPPSDFSTREIEAWRDKQLSRTISVKVNDAMREKAGQGWYPSNHLPLGYTLQKARDEFGKELKRGSIVVRDPDEKRVRWVKMEFELRAKGFSFEAIRKAVIDADLLPLAKVKEYRVSAIEKRVKNPFYEGRFFWQGVEYKGKHELIITPSIFAAAQRKNLRGFKPRILSGEGGFFAGGWLHCGECGCQIVYDPKTKVLITSGKRVTFHYYHSTRHEHRREKNLGTARHSSGCNQCHNRHRTKACR